VRPGLYQEGIVIDTRVEMIGDGDLGEVVIEAKGRDVALFQASDGLDRESHLRKLAHRPATGGRAGERARGKKVKNRNRSSRASFRLPAETPG
jgi:hypothetical protein